MDQVPIPRRNQALQSDVRACSPGMIVTDERRAFALLGPRGPHAALGRLRHAARVRGTRQVHQPEGSLDLERVITSGAAHVAVADGRSYGQVVDALLIRLRGRSNLTFISGEGTTEKLARMIRAGHADLVLGLAYEADLVSREAGLEGADLEFWPIAQQESLASTRHWLPSRRPRCRRHPAHKFAVYESGPEAASAVFLRCPIAAAGPQASARPDTAGASIRPGRQRP